MKATYEIHDVGLNAAFQNRARCVQRSCIHASLMQVESLLHHRKQGHDDDAYLATPMKKRLELVNAAYPIIEACFPAIFKRIPPKGSIDLLFSWHQCKKIPLNQHNPTIVPSDAPNADKGVYGQTACLFVSMAWIRETIFAADGLGARPRHPVPLVSRSPRPPVPSEMLQTCMEIE